jgi:hypothetical protein
MPKPLTSKMYVVLSFSSLAEPLAKALSGTPSEVTTEICLETGWRPHPSFDKIFSVKQKLVENQKRTLSGRGSGFAAKSDTWSKNQPRGPLSATIS